MINPSTTLAQDQEISAEDLAAILNQFATELGMSITQTDILTDPVAGLLTNTISSLSTAQLAKIRLQVVLYGLQRVMQGSNHISELTTTAFIASATSGSAGGDGDDAVYNIIAALITGVRNAIDPAVLNAFTSNANYLTAVGSGAPEVTVADLLATAITITDRIAEAGYGACNSYHNSAGAGWTAAGNAAAIQAETTPLIGQISTWASSLGGRYYGANHQAEIAAIPNLHQTLSTDPSINAGFACASQFFEIDGSNNVVCIAE